MQAAAPGPEAPASRGRGWVRRFPPPLLAVVVTFALAIWALPSALNLPQANPGQLAEYAPVPGSSNVASAGANFSALGLGNSAEGNPGGLPPQPPPGSGNLPPSQFQCVGNPPRQTEDPLSPPCVPYFTGDNGGSTWQGVTGTEVKIVYFITCDTGTSGGTFAPTSQGSEDMGKTCNQLIDLDQSPQSSDFILTRALRRYAVYFNSRYQTYKRHVHMYAFYGHFNPASNPSGNPSCDQACVMSDAATLWSEMHPFGVVLLDQVGWGFMDQVSNYFASRKVLIMGNDSPEHESFFQQYPGYVWTYIPSVEQRAEQFGSWLCQKIVGQPVSYSGNGDIGRPRKLGLLYTDVQGSGYPDIVNAVKPIVQKCGGVFADIHAYEGSGSVGDGSSSGEQSDLQDIADFSSQKITTVVWIGLQNGDFPRDASQLNWQPEWAIFGDGVMEDFVTPRWTDSGGNGDSWLHAFVNTNVTLVGGPLDQPCAQALRSVDPSYPSIDLGFTCSMYNDIRQLFTGIQVAGPHLDPSHIDTGFHAIPPVSSTDPQVPACYYAPGDYTCVKDTIAMWWDPNGSINGYSGQGCWRVPQGGKRYRAWSWPSGNFDAQKGTASTDPCNGYTSNGSFNPYQQ